jgi:hypothetical protein
LDKQFWPGVSFGISSITASFAELEECMMQKYYNLLPISGIRQSVWRELRQMDRGFYGCGFPHPGVESIWDLQATNLPAQQAFPLEPISVFVGQTKITADTDGYVRYWAHRHLAEANFHSLGILFAQEFEYVDWEMVYETLRSVPQLFQVWACKQVMGVAGTMEWDRSTVRVCIMEYAHGRGGKTMESICAGLDLQFLLMAREQDTIGWRCFMEGMVSTRMRSLQCNYHHLQGTHMNPKRWARWLIQKLLEATHGQWIYWNIQIHDSGAGTQATLRKEAIQWEIEEQMDLGGAGLLEEDQWMLEVNLRDLETTGGEKEEYWLLAIKAARTAATLTRVQTHPALQPAD